MPQRRKTHVKRAEIVVSGAVQGVGFRYQVRALASKFHLAGHAKNLDDGTVEIICEGSQESITALIDKIRALKPPIEVEDVQATYSDARGLTKFEIILGDPTQELVEGLGTGAVYMNILMSKQDQMLDKQDQMLGKQDQMLDKQDQTVSEIRNLASTLERTMDARFEKLEKEVREIKARLPN